jgi:hypothetical protein
MRSVLVEMLHIFVMLTIVGFGIACLLASSGMFDTWNRRLKKRENRFQ